MEGTIKKLKVFQFTRTFRAAHGGRTPLLNYETWHSRNLPKMVQKNINHGTHPVSSTNISIFLT